MAAPSLHSLENASELIIKDITELCDSCIKLTEAIVADSGKLFGGEGMRQYNRYEAQICTQDCGMDSCRLCEIMAEQFYN